MSQAETALTVRSGQELGHLADVAERTREYIAASKAANTVRAYRADWQHFSAWCAAQGLDALPASPQTLALYLTAHAMALKTSTLQRRLSAISQAHQHAGQASPTADPIARATWAGIRRAHGTAQRQKAPAVVDQLRAMLEALPPGLIGARDRALLLLGFSGAFRRSELVSLDVGDVQITRAGLVVTLRRSKTDQLGEGRKIGIPNGTAAATCPVAAVKGWLKLAGIRDGPLFRPINRHGQLGAGRLSDRAVALVIKRHAAAAGLDPEEYSGHSLRAGFATSAAAAGVEERHIAQQTGHRSMTVLRRYIRDGELLGQSNAAGRVGL